MKNLRQSLLFPIVRVLLVMILFLLLFLVLLQQVHIVQVLSLVLLLLPPGSFTSADSAGIIACSTSSPAANSTDAATSAFFD